jgi:hypothetical protein
MMSPLIIGETQTGRYLIERCKFYIIVGPPQSPLPQTGRRKLLDTICAFEDRTGRTWPDLVADGFKVMKVFASLVDCTDQAMPEYTKRKSQALARERGGIA